MSLFKKTMLLALPVVLALGMRAEAQSTVNQSDPFASATKKPNPFDDAKRTSKNEPAANARQPDVTPHDSVLRANRKILQKLERPFIADFFETRFADVVDELKNDLEMPIVIHESAVEENLDEDQLITLNLAGLSARNSLRVMLRPYQCTFQVADDVIYIMSEDAALSLLETRIFNCRKLLTALSGPQENVDKLINVIQSSVEPKTWEINGGKGAISEIGGLLVITQSSRIQIEIEQLLEELSQRVFEATNK